ncbi:transferase [Streptomyces sp. Ru73]|uniref:RraA family protein n=1 Tax=Streptomyces sp. Ru73 TaxID=2080748 RepID=UPI000CDDDF8C|nr:NAD(P)-binding domain-containing protein [Streptomyces sp. Ru73]POX37322.1 transferase [Streptomyces sp. Ru73]
MKVGILGLGEAGALYARGFVENGRQVAGFDPADVPTPEGVERAATAADAVRDCDLVLGLTGAKASLAVAREAAPHLRATAVYADMNAAAPELKRQIAEVIAESSGAAFADVSVIGSVPKYRHRTALVTSGPGAPSVAAHFGALGAPVEDLGADPGAASARKLLRSLFMKGLGALIVTAVEAGRAAGDEHWVRRQIAGELADGGAALDRLYDGTYKHAERRAREVSAAADLLADLGLDAGLARAVGELHALAGRPEGLRDTSRLTPEVLAAYAGLPTANIGDATERLGLLDSGISALWPGARAVGRALTVWTRAGDNHALHEAVKVAQPGDILVVNGEGDVSRALVGELIAERARARGVVGMVLDGAARDVDVLAEMGFPVWARAVTPAGPYKFGPGRVGVPVAVGGVVCRPGDLVAGDGDGVAVVPAERAATVLAAAREVEAEEARRRAGIRATAAAAPGGAS